MQYCRPRLRSSFHRAIRSTESNAAFNESNPQRLLKLFPTLGDSVYALEKDKIKYFSPDGATKANDILCSSILAILPTHNFEIKTILLKNNFDGKKLSASIYLLVSIYVLYFGGIATCFC